MIEARTPLMEAMKVSGHTQINTFARYVNPTTQAVKEVAKNLEAFNNKARAKKRRR